MSKKSLIINAVKLLAALLFIAVIVFVPQILMKLKTQVENDALSQNALQTATNLTEGKLSEAKIIEKLKTLMDPEFKINIVDFGLYRSSTIDIHGNVTVHIIFTTPKCPFNEYFEKNIKKYVSQINSVKSVKVVVDSEPAWSRELLTEAGRKKYKELFGWTPK